VTELSRTAAPENLALTTQELMLTHLKNDTRAYRIFQAIHQNILVPALLALQTKLYSVLQKEGFLAASGAHDPQNVLLSSGNQGLGPA